MLAGFVVALFSGLAVVGIVAYLRRRRLCYVSPRLFDYSDLSENHRTVELLILNLGRRAELDVELELSPSFNYTLLAATKSGLEFIDGNTLKLKRLPPKSEISLIFVAEGSSQFSESNIGGLSSQDTSGTSIQSIQEAQTSGPAALLALAIIMVATFGLGKIVEHLVWPFIVSSPLISAFDDEVPDFAVCYSDFYYRSDRSELEEAPMASDWFTVERVWRRMDGLYASVRFENKLPEPAEVSMFSSTLGQLHFEFIPSVWEETIIDHVVNVDDVAEFVVGAYVPRDSLVHAFEVLIHVETMSGTLVSARQRIGAANTKVSCPGLSSTDF